MHTIRPFTATRAEYQALADLHEAISGNNHHQAADFQHMDQIRGDLPFGRFVIAESDRFIAIGTFGQSLWLGSPGRLHLTIEVHPDISWTKLADPIYQYLNEQAQAFQPHTFSAGARADETECIHFWRTLGFEPRVEEARFALDLGKFDPNSFANAKTTPEGIEIISLADLQVSDPHWLEKWWALEGLILADMATPEEPAQPRTLTEFEQDVQHPAIIPEAFFFAITPEAYVALTGLTRYDEVTFMADLTWAIPSHQNRGLELALKLTAIDWAQAQRATYIIEEALEDDPSYQLNQHLGFENLPPWLIFEKRLQKD